MVQRKESAVENWNSRAGREWGGEGEGSIDLLPFAMWCFMSLTWDRRDVFWPLPHHIEVERVDQTKASKFRMSALLSEKQQKLSGFLVKNAALCTCKQLLAEVSPIGSLASELNIPNFASNLTTSFLTEVVSTFIPTTEPSPFYKYRPISCSAKRCHCPREFICLTEFKTVAECGIYHEPSMCWAVYMYLSCFSQNLARY